MVFLDRVISDSIAPTAPEPPVRRAPASNEEIEPTAEAPVEAPQPDQDSKETTDEPPVQMKRSPQPAAPSPPGPSAATRPNPPARVERADTPTPPTEPPARGARRGPAATESIDTRSTPAPASAREPVAGPAPEEIAPDVAPTLETPSESAAHTEPREELDALHDVTAPEGMPETTITSAHGEVRYAEVPDRLPTGLPPPPRARQPDRDAATAPTPARTEPTPMARPIDAPPSRTGPIVEIGHLEVIVESPRPPSAAAPTPPLPMPGADASARRPPRRL